MANKILEQNLKIKYNHLFSINWQYEYCGLTLHIYSNIYNALALWYFNLQSLHVERLSYVFLVWTSKCMRAVFQAERTFLKTFTFYLPNIVDRALCPLFLKTVVSGPFSCLLISEKRRSRKSYLKRKRTKVRKDTTKLIKPRGRSTISKNVANK